MLRVGTSSQIVREPLSGGRPSTQMTNDSAFWRLPAFGRFFSDWRPCLVAMCFGLLLFQGCALLQQPPDIAMPTETPVQPAAPKTSAGVQPAPSKPVQPPGKTSPATAAKLPQTGEASWYGAQHQGKQT